MVVQKFMSPVLYRHGTPNTPFAQSLNDMTRSARRWANDIGGTSDPETDVIPQITQDINEIKRLVVAAYTVTLDLNKVWASPLFPQWDSIIRYNECPSRVPISFTYGVSHRSDVKLYRLDGNRAIGWVEFVPRWHVDGVSLDTREHEGSPVMIIRQSTVDDAFPYNWSEQRVQDELCSQIFRLLQDKLALYYAVNLVEKGVRSNTPFVPAGDKTPPSFLGEYVKKDVFDAFKAGIESSVNRNTSSIPALETRVETVEGKVASLEASGVGGLAELKQQVQLNKNELFTLSTRVEYNENLIGEHQVKLNGLDTLKDQVAHNKNDLFTLGTRVEYNENQIGDLQVKANSIDGLKSDVDSTKSTVNSIRSEQSDIKREVRQHATDIQNLKAANLNPDDFVTKTSFFATVEQMPTTQGMRQEIREAVEGVEAGVEASYVKKTEVAELKKLQEQLGKVDVSSFATGSQLAQQQQNIESWGNERFELKGAAYNLINDAKKTITSETDTKVNGLSGRINAAVNETDSLRKSTRQNLDALSGTVSAMDTRLSNGLANLRTETDAKINNRLPMLSASDGMILVADNALAVKWKSTHYSLSIDNLIKERTEGFILNGTGRMTDGTGRGGFVYSTVAFNGSDGSFLVPANQPSERNIFFGDRIHLKEPIFKFSFDAKYGDRNNNTDIRFNIRWFDRSGRELSNYLRGALSATPTQFPATYTTWVVAPSHAEFCEVGIVSASFAASLYLTNVKVQFATDIPEETLWRFTLAETYRPVDLGENKMWLTLDIGTHGSVQVHGIINNGGAVPTGRYVSASQPLPLILQTPLFNLNSPMGGLYTVDSGGLKLEGRFESTPPTGMRMGSMFKIKSSSIAHEFQKFAQSSTSIRIRPLQGLNNNGTTGY